MGLFSLYGAKKPSSKGGDNPNLVSLPPDERKRPESLHKSREEKHWKDSEGDISKRDVELAKIELRRSGMSRRKVEIVDAALHSALNEPGRDKINSGELNEVMEALDDGAHHLGLDRKKDLGRIHDALEKRL